MESGEDVLAQVGSSFSAKMADLGRITLFGIHTILKFSSKPLRLVKILQQIYIQGYASLPVILSTSVVTGMVLALQLSVTLSRFGASSKTPQALALSLVRELGPVLASLMYVGKAGGQMASELGTMSVNEQIKALKVMAIDPINYLIVNRVLAAIICVPFLVTIFDLAGIGAGGLMMNLSHNFTLRFYFNEALDIITFSDLMGGWIKAILFGLIISIICCWKGFSAGGGSAGVGRATTQAVATSSISIIVLDLILTKINMTWID